MTQRCGPPARAARHSSPRQVALTTTAIGCLLMRDLPSVYPDPVTREIDGDIKNKPGNWRAVPSERPLTWSRVAAPATARVIAALTVVLAEFAIPTS
jgi:hypothetical protein